MSQLSNNEASRLPIDESTSNSSSEAEIPETYGNHRITLADQNIYGSEVIDLTSDDDSVGLAFGVLATRTSS